LKLPRRSKFLIKTYLSLFSPKAAKLIKVDYKHQPFVTLFTIFSGYLYKIAKMFVFWGWAGVTE